MNRTISSPTFYDANSSRVAGSPINRTGIYDRLFFSISFPFVFVIPYSYFPRTFYYMKKPHMYQLQEKPNMQFPLWVRDFVEAFQDIDSH
jgi:hypothetical protein